MCFTELPYAAEARTFVTRAVLTLELLEDSRAQQRKISLRLMPLGGSVTYGQGSTDGNGYRNYLRQLLVLNGCEVDMVGSRKAGSMEDNDNEGWRGYRIDQILAKAEKSASAHMPNIFTVNAGSNDCIQDFEIHGAGGRIHHMLESLWKRCPAATIILSTLLMTAQDSAEQRVLRVNSQLVSLVEKELSGQRKIVLVDMHGADGPQLCDLVDGVHPNDDGYKKMAQIWYQGIQEAIHKGFL
ncbi:uncharacterized protein Z520_11447 [Fonsecaea multimorphosa CBS 102226]|uniref:SGNH hydrolase-type esterase domain-containing protein n=1 Tax=Fonsecaea multimorphosa CBS 102226 TaxID=1442371 RepID=A0A0D2JQM9_9EURO|nr:uncharacterized protein Z520_11447 [Fonsecaea multimorphosa CBS 102226]KIX92784.1 hypothetical protein Z520_11447 [Fonsecaea multimorphosa CBS 102226]